VETTCVTRPISSSEPNFDRPIRRRRWGRVAVLLMVVSVGGVLTWRQISERVLTVGFRMDWARCHASLSDAEQARLAERNRRLIPAKVALPGWVTVRTTTSGPQRAGKCQWGGDDDESPTRVYAVTTRIDLDIPALPTVQAWFADHPDNPYGAGLDAAWDHDLYGRFWAVFLQVGERLRTMGFTEQGTAAPAGQSGSLSLRGDGVLVDFGFDAASPRIAITRYW
jgi:hypothetical protein